MHDPRRRTFAADRVITVHRVLGSGLNTVHIRPFALSLSKGVAGLRQAQPERKMGYVNSIEA